MSYCNQGFIESLVKFRASTGEPKAFGRKDIIRWKISLKKKFNLQNQTQMTFSKAHLKTEKEPNLKLHFGVEETWPHGADLIHGLIKCVRGLR